MAKNSESIKRIVMDVDGNEWLAVLWMEDYVLVESLDGEHKAAIPDDRIVRPEQGSIGSAKIEIDVTDALKGLKAVQREAKNTVRALKEVESFSNEEKLFVIELDSIDSVPMVFYKGVEITHKTAMTMGWGTKNEFHSGDAHISIDYIEIDEFGMPTNKKIRESRKPNNENTIGGI